MAEKSTPIQAITAHDYEKYAGSGPGMFGRAHASHDDQGIIQGTVDHNNGHAGEIQRGLKSRHIQFL